MGLLGDIKRIVSGRCPAAVLPRSEFQIEAPSVALIDYLTTIYGVDQAVCYTIDVLFDHFWQQADARVLAGCRDVVFLCDAQSNVPPHKGSEQDKRRVSAKKADVKKGLEEAIPYPRDAVFDLNGSGMIHYTLDGTTIIEPICLRRLRLSKQLRTLLWQTFVQRIKHRVSGLGHHVTIWFDFDPTGPWRFHRKSGVVIGGGEDGTDDPVEATHHTELAHYLGESDPALFWWAHYFQQQQPPPSQVHLLTNDSDMMPLATLYQLRDRCPVKSSIFWHCDNKIIIDLTRFYALMTRGLGVTPMQFVFWCIYCGTDYLEKSEVTHGIGADRVLDGLKGCRLNWHPESTHKFPFQMALNAIYNRDYCDKTVANVPKWAEKPLPVLSTTELRQAFPAVEASSSSPVPKRSNSAVVYPSDSNLTVSSRAQFTFQYWWHASDGKHWTESDPDYSLSTGDESPSKRIRTE